jgi:dihydroflavonol-4-reductase
MTKSVLLTGVSGFIAKHCALAFLKAGYSVRGTVRKLDRSSEVRAALSPHLTPLELSRLSFMQADLERDIGWPEAMAGMDAVIHTASPFPIAQPRNADELIRPAVEGTRRVLNAAAAAGVQRVVLTSSTVAIIDLTQNRVQDESDWCNTDAPGVTAYARSKTLAEQAAWALAEEKGLRLTTINPGLVLGAPLDGAYGSSVRLVRRLLSGKDPMQPNLGFPIVDVRDVATMHLRALERPDSVGNRIIASAGSLSMVQMGRILARAYPDRRIATRLAPTLLLRLLGLFDAEVRSILPALGHMGRVSNVRAISALGMSFTPPEEALLATAAFVVAEGK